MKDDQKPKEQLRNELRILRQRTAELEKSEPEHKQAQEALRESEGKYRTILEAIEEGYFEVDLAGNMTFFNDSLCKISGFLPGELMGMNNREYTTPQTAKRMYQLFSRIHRTGNPERIMDHEIITRDGTRRVLEMSASLMRNSSGQPIGFRGIVRDITERKQAEEALRQSEERYKTLFDRNLSCVFLHDLEGRFVDANDAALNLLGYTRAEIPFLDFYSFIGEDQLPTAFKNLEEILQTGHQKTPTQFKLKRKDGRYVWVVTEASLIYRDGSPYAVQGIARDITDQRQAEEALRKSEERYRSLFEQSRDAIYITSKKGNLVYINQSFLGLFGYTREEITDLNATNTYVNPNDRSRFQREIEEKGSVRDYELKLRKKDGTQMDCLLTATTRLTNSGSILGYQGIIRDITEQKRADQKIKEYSKNLERMVEVRTRRLNQALHDAEEARDKIHGILQSVAEGLIVTDIKNRIILMNRAAEDLLDVRFSAVVNRPIKFAIQEKTLRDRITTALHKRETGYRFDFELPGADMKHPRIMRARTSVIHGKTDEETYIVTVMHDMTDEREVDRMKTEFISTAAHELRTPLTSIRGFSEILLKRDNIKEQEKKKFLSYINRQSVNLASIITDLLDISRIESDVGFSLKKAPCNIARIINDVVPYFQEQSPKHIFELALPEGSVDVMVDKEKIGQVLGNILSNAVKYSPDGGPISLSAKLIADSGLDSDLSYRERKIQNPQCIEISVVDTGIGMTQGQVERMFDRFYRADASDAAVPGTGLGMSIVKNLVEAHGGKVWVESRVAKGTKVSFTIPIKDDGTRRNVESIRQSA